MLPLILLYSIYTCKVLGAAMIYAKVGESTIVYTGDYNMTPDRHLGAAHIDRLQLDLLITEYGAYTILCKLITSALTLLVNAFNLSYGTLLKELMEKMCRMFWKKAGATEGGRKQKREKKREKNLESIDPSLRCPCDPSLRCPCDPSPVGDFFSQHGEKERGDIHKCVAGGGKVLIPTFALGRAQVLAVSIEGGRKKKREKNTWSPLHPRDPSHAGGFFSPRGEKKSLPAWGEGTRRLFNIVLVFCDHTVCPFDRSLINAPGPCVLFATPGMISGGFSLEVFKQWAPSELNLITLPGYNYITINIVLGNHLAGYCVAGTIGHKLMSGKPTRIDLDKDTYVDVRCQVLMQC
ncbi:hypothetical protein GW17_00015692 [Ensete ventricosum]|nr:hypothetical protein GW17_00015692 [Ensete ventricosum]